MIDEDYSFYDNPKEPRVAKCLNVPLPLTSFDKQLIRRSEMKPNFSSSSACHSEMKTKSAADYEFESTCTHCANSFQSSTAAEFVVESSNIPIWEHGNSANFEPKTKSLRRLICES